MSTSPISRWDAVFEDYGPAYELGWTGYAIYGGEFDTADRVLANDWIVQKGVSALSWDQARPACRAAWRRAHNATSYKSDGSASPEVIIEALKELADNACDAELGFIEAAGHTQTPALVAVFERSAQSWRAAAAELQEQSGKMGAPVEDAGTVTAAAQRIWLQIRSLFGGASDETLLAECVRGDEVALSSYRMALQQNLPAEIHEVVQQQFERTQRNHDLIRSLLEQARADVTASPASPPERHASIFHTLAFHTSAFQALAFLSYCSYCDAARGTADDATPSSPTRYRLRPTPPLIAPS